MNFQIVYNTTLRIKLINVLSSQDEMGVVGAGVIQNEKNVFVNNLM